jgi:hypothetical protein
VTCTASNTKPPLRQALARLKIKVTLVCARWAPLALK